jgi:hypothetical protein
VEQVVHGLACASQRLVVTEEQANDRVLRLREEAVEAQEKFVSQAIVVKRY